MNLQSELALMEDRNQFRLADFGRGRYVLRLHGSMYVQDMVTSSSFMDSDSGIAKQPLSVTAPGLTGAGFDE